MLEFRVKGKRTQLVTRLQCPGCNLTLSASLCSPQPASAAANLWPHGQGHSGRRADAPLLGAVRQSGRRTGLRGTVSHRRRTGRFQHLSLSGENISLVSFPVLDRFNYVTVAGTIVSRIYVGGDSRGKTFLCRLGKARYSSISVFLSLKGSPCRGCFKRPACCFGFRSSAGLKNKRLCWSATGLVVSVNLRPKISCEFPRSSKSCDRTRRATRRQWPWVSVLTVIAAAVS